MGVIPATVSSALRSLLLTVIANILIIVSLSVEFFLFRQIWCWWDIIHHLTIAVIRDSSPNLVEARDARNMDPLERTATRLGWAARWRDRVLPVRLVNQGLYHPAEEILARAGAFIDRPRLLAVCRPIFTFSWQRFRQFWFLQVTARVEALEEAGAPGAHISRSEICTLHWLKEEIPFAREYL